MYAQIYEYNRPSPVLSFVIYGCRADHFQLDKE